MHNQSDLVGNLAILTWGKTIISMTCPAARSECRKGLSISTEMSQFKIQPRYFLTFKSTHRHSCT